MTESISSTDLLVQVANPLQTAETITSLVEETNTIDWDELLELARVHGVIPMLTRFTEQFEPIAPGGWIQALEQANREITAKNLALTEVLSEITEELQLAGIDLLAFKGPVLEQVAYDTVSGRDYGDLDILVDRDDLPRAVSHLETIGFSPQGQLPSPTTALRGGRFRPPLLNEYSMQRGGTEIELRWRIGDQDRPFSPSFEELVARHEQVTINGETIPVLHPTDRIQMLAHHGTKHRWHLLKWISDFAAASGTFDGSWDHVLEQSMDNGNRRRLLLGFALCEILFDIDSPNPIPEALDLDPTAHRLANTVGRSILAGRTSRPGSVEGFLFNLRAADSFFDRLRMVSQYRPIHPNLPDYQVLPLPHSMHAAYYVVRPIRLLSSRLQSTLRA